MRRYIGLFALTVLICALAGRGWVRGQDRVERRGSDHETVAYLTAADAAYRSLPELTGVVVIDANRTPDVVNAEIHAHLSAYLPATTAVPRRHHAPPLDDRRSHHSRS